VKKTVQILILLIYVFGISKLGFVYSTHNFFHGLAHEEHSHSDCSVDCTIIIEAQKSDTATEAKFFKISINNLSSHLIFEDVFIQRENCNQIITQNAEPPLLIYSAVPTPPPIG